MSTTSDATTRRTAAATYTRRRAMSGISAIFATAFGLGYVTSANANTCPKGGAHQCRRSRLPGMWGGGRAAGSVGENTYVDNPQ